MLSILMPYWRRERLLRESLGQYDALYPDLDLEIVIADDGSGLNLEHPRVRVINLPLKDVPKNPCVPYNVAAREAKGDIFLITNPEIRHENPVIPEMLRELQELGEKGYVIASCWSVEQERWYCHTTRHSPGCDKVPDGFGLHFCSMLYRSLWDEIGGFDEEYRDGAGYDDNDLCYALSNVGAKPKIRDDLVVNHYSTRCNWNGEGFLRNKKIFYKKWELKWK